MNMVKALVKTDDETDYILWPWPYWIDGNTGAPMTDINLGYEIDEDFNPPDFL